MYTERFYARMKKLAMEAPRQISEDTRRTLDPIINKHLGPLLTDEKEGMPLTADEQALQDYWASAYSEKMRPHMEAYGNKWGQGDPEAKMPRAFIHGVLRGSAGQKGLPPQIQALRREALKSGVSPADLRTMGYGFWETPAWKGGWSPKQISIGAGVGPAVSSAPGLLHYLLLKNKE